MAKAEGNPTVGKTHRKEARGVCPRLSGDPTVDPPAGSKADSGRQSVTWQVMILETDSYLELGGDAPSLSWEERHGLSPSTNTSRHQPRAGTRRGQPGVQGTRQRNALCDWRGSSPLNVWPGPCTPPLRPADANFGS